MKKENDVIENNYIFEEPTFKITNAFEAKDSDIIESLNMNYSIYKLGLIDNIEITDLLFTDEGYDKRILGDFDMIKAPTKKIFIDPYTREFPENGVNVILSYPFTKIVIVNIKPLITQLNIEERIRKHYTVGYLMWQIAKVYKILYAKYSNDIGIFKYPIENLYIERIDIRKSGLITLIIEG